MNLFGALTPLIYYVAWSPWVLVASAVTDALVGIGLELVWMIAVIDVAERIAPPSTSRSAPRWPGSAAWPARSSGGW
jgi:hypothetical protein